MHFKWEYAFLSNFYPSPFEHLGTHYDTVEHFYQTMKADLPEDREKIRTAKTPAIAKKLGKTVLIRDGWNERKDLVMRIGLVHKFQIPELRDKLLALGGVEIVEENWWGDTYWGVCRGVGENKLGKLLMEIRAELNRQ